MDAGGDTSSENKHESFPFDNPLEIQLSGGQSLVFAGCDQLEKWVAGERQCWAWLESASRAHRMLNDLWNAPNTAWSKATKLINAYKSSAAEKRTEIVSRLQSEPWGPYHDDLWAYPSSFPRAQFILRLAKMSGAEHAAFTLFTFIKPKFIDQVLREHTGALPGAIDAFMFVHGVSSEGILAGQEALSIAVQDWHQTISDLKSEKTEWNRKFSDQDASLAKIREEHIADFKQQLADIANELLQVRKTYDEQLALLAPVEYWEKKAKSHLITSISFAIAASAAASLVAWLGWEMVSGLLIPHASQVSPVVPSGPTYDIKTEYWRYGVVIAAGTLMVWPLRILVRLLVSHLHLRGDAKERVTMVKTYLALVRSKEALNEADRKLILESLFRPSSSGLIHDDAAPASAIYLLSKLMSGDKRGGI